jgi:hypothetical protein
MLGVSAVAAIGLHGVLDMSDRTQWVPRRCWLERQLEQQIREISAAIYADPAQTIRLDNSWLSEGAEAGTPAVRNSETCSTDCRKRLTSDEEDEIAERVGKLADALGDGDY